MRQNSNISFDPTDTCWGAEERREFFAVKYYSSKYFSQQRSRGYPHQYAGSGNHPKTLSQP